jgi:molybdenum cofactor guanylyltransferase
MVATRSRCTGVILAGGANARFGGRAKGLESIGGRTIIERVAASMRPTVDNLLVIANAPDAERWLPGVRVAADVRSERGSLVGVHAALTHALSAVLLAAWDMPFLSTRLLEDLRREGESRGCAVVPTSPRGAEPLCAYYPASALLVAEQLLDSGEMRLNAFVEALPCATRMSPSRVATFGDPATLFFNVNDAESLARAREIAARAIGEPGA